MDTTCALSAGAIVFLVTDASPWTRDQKHFLLWLDHFTIGLLTDTTRFRRQRERQAGREGIELCQSFIEKRVVSGDGEVLERYGPTVYSVHSPTRGTKKVKHFDRIDNGVVNS